MSVKKELHAAEARLQTFSIYGVFVVSCLFAKTYHTFFLVVFIGKFIVYPLQKQTTIFFFSTLVSYNQSSSSSKNIFPTHLIYPNKSADKFRITKLIKFQSWAIQQLVNEVWEISLIRHIQGEFSFFFLNYIFSPVSCYHFHFVQKYSISQCNLSIIGNQ